MSYEAPPAGSTAAELFTPTAFGLVDVDAPVPDLQFGPSAEGPSYADARILVRLHGEPLGMVALPLTDGRATAVAVAEAICEQLGVELHRHVLLRGCLEGVELDPAVLLSGLRLSHRSCSASRRSAGPRPPVAVIVPTSGRAAQLRLCLESLLALEYPAYEIVVVDNLPSNASTREVVAEFAGRTPNVRYLAEPRPGSSVARNRGIAETTAEIVAFTDDDVTVDAGWLDWVVDPFRRDPEVAVTTGLVMPACFDTSAQRSFQEYMGFDKGFERRVYDRAGNGIEEPPLYPYAGGVFGSGNSMAFRRGPLVEIGGFDPALGAGSLALAGSDIEAFTHLVLRGRRLVYEPRAICWHDHRRDGSALKRQIFNYGVGFTAILAKWVVRRPGLLLTMLRSPFMLARRVPRGPASDADAHELLWELVRGYVRGPIYYVRSVRWARRLRLQDVLPPSPETR